MCISKHKKADQLGALKEGHAKCSRLFRRNFYSIDSVNVAYLKPCSADKFHN